jgi:hypothetical protein
MRNAKRAFVAALVCLVAGSVSAQITALAPGYVSGLVTLPEEAGGSVCADAANLNAFYVSAGGFNNRTIYRVTFTSQTTYTSQLVASGSVSTTGATSGNNIFDNRFGDIWMGSLADGRLLVTDSGAGQDGFGGPAAGECIFILEDKNGDGDFMDNDPGFPGDEVSVLVAAPILTNAGGNFTGAGIVEGPAGNFYCVTSDGSANGEVIRISSDGTAQNLFASPFDFGSGIDFNSTGTLLAGNTDGTFIGGSITQMNDTDMSGDAGQPGETTVITTAGFPAVYGLSVSSVADGERILVTTNGIDGSKFQAFSGGTLTSIATLTDFATGMALDGSTASFAPFSGSNGAHAIVSDLSFSTFQGAYYFITPTGAASVADWSAFN